jgi:hypothetical protein
LTVSSDDRASRHRRLALIAAAIAVVAVAGGGALLAAGHSSSASSSSTSGPAAPSTPGSSSSRSFVAAVSVGALKAFSVSLGHPLYWAGPQAGVVYEFTEAADGRVYLRYLTGGVKIGTPRPNFLTIGTYLVPDAAAAVRRATHQHGAVTLALRGGAIGFYNRARPTSVYFAYPGSRVQVETYDPSAAVARALVLSGAVQPVH